MGDYGQSGRPEIRRVMTDSKQTQAWASKFGKEYTDRNAMSVEDMDLMYLQRYGVSRSDMNYRFLDNVDKNIKILEVGSNIGLQLQFLQKMGFKNLYGIEVSSYAVELAKSRTMGINIIEGNALDIPFKDGWFDLVFTSGVLIHIPPNNLPAVMEEIVRCSNRYIWGFEYFAKQLTQVQYRECEQTSNLLWKNNFPKLYGMSVVKLQKFKVKDTKFEDVMFLLEQT